MPQLHFAGVFSIENKETQISYEKTKSYISFATNDQMKIIVLEFVYPIIYNTFQWDKGKIFTHFNPLTTRKILNIHLSPTQLEDKFIWVPNSSGKFTTKSTFLNDQNPMLDATRLYLQGLELPLECENICSFQADA